MIADHGLDRYIRYSHLVTGLEFDEEAGTWRVDIADREPIVARTAGIASVEAVRTIRWP